MKRITSMLVCLMLFGSIAIHAQDIQIKGTVTSAEDGSPVPGVSVVIKGTKTGMATDVNGTYSLTAPSDATLVFSAVGMKQQEVPVAGQTTINVTMETEVVGLEEVVVTALGIKRSEKALGYAATQVTSEEITKSRTNSALNSLQGKIAGVNVSTASGAPGASTKVILRGYSSLTGSNEPLFVLDGVPINNSASNFMDPNNSVNRTQDFGNRINDINPDDIESMTVLKGAAATAQYGSRAANGVIVITTKSGSLNQKLSVDFTSSYMASTPLRLPQLQNSFGQGWNGHFAFEENGSWGPPLDGKERLWGNVVDNSQQLKPFSAQKNNLKDFYEVGSTFMNSLSVSGGTDIATYYLSYNNTTENGVVPGDHDSYKRNTITLKGDIKGKKLTSSANISYINKKSSYVTTGQGGDGTTVFQEIIQIPRDMSIVDFSDYNYKFNNLDNYFTVYAQNPYFALNENGDAFNEDRVYGNLDFDYELTKWLKARYRIGTDVSNDQLSDWVAIAKTDPESPNASQTQIPGAVTERARLARETNSDLYLISTNKVSSGLTINGLLGYNVNERYFKNSYAYGSSLNVPGFYKLENATEFPIPPSVTESKRRLYGVLAQVDFDYKGYLYLSLGARNDWSSTLPENNNSFFYPTANASFVFTDVIEGLKPLLSFGKLRASWGKTGNDAPPYSVKSVFTPGNIYLPFGQIAFPFAGVNAFEVSNQIGNPELSPELTQEYEFGGDLRFFNSRVNFDIAYYNRITTKQILAVPIATTSGYTTQVKNFGKVRNRGIELMVNLIPVRTSNLNWNITLTYSNNQNEVIELTKGLEKVVLTSVYGIDFVAIPGKPLGTFLGHAPDMDDQGRIIVNASGIPTTAADKVEYGNIQPKYLAGITTGLGYKNLSFTCSFDIREGGLMYSYTKRLNFFVGNATNTLYNDRQPWLVPNSVMDDGTGNYVENTVPIDVATVADYWNQTQNNMISRDHIIDRSYVKLREVVLSYNLPKKAVTKIKLSDIQISLIGRNLLLWTPKENNIIDPEITTFGNDLLGDFGEFAAGPTIRSFGGSIKLSF